MNLTTFRVIWRNGWTGEIKKSREYEVSSRDEAKDKFIEEFCSDLDESLKSGIKQFDLSTVYVSGWKDETKIIRCVPCGSEFSEVEIEDVTNCPSCGSKSIPMSIKDDVEIKVNWHELRILGIWAENWAKHCDEKSKEDPNHENMLLTIMSIAQRLQRQFPDRTPLTLFSEIRNLRKDYKIETNIDDDAQLGLD